MKRKLTNLLVRYKTLTPEEHATSIYNAWIDIIPYAIGYSFAKGYFFLSLLLFFFQGTIVYIFSVIYFFILHDIYGRD